MQEITTFLTYNDKAEEAAEFYSTAEMPKIEIPEMEQAYEGLITARRRRGT